MKLLDEIPMALSGGPCSVATLRGWLCVKVTRTHGKLQEALDLLERQKRVRQRKDGRYENVRT